MNSPAHLFRTILDTAATGRSISNATLGRLRWTDTDAAHAMRTVVDDLAELTRSGHLNRAAALRVEALDDLAPLLAGSAA